MNKSFGRCLIISYKEQKIHTIHRTSSNPNKKSTKDSWLILNYIQIFTHVWVYIHSFTKRNMLCLDYILLFRMMQKHAYYHKFAFSFNRSNLLFNHYYRCRYYQIQFDTHLLQTNPNNKSFICMYPTFILCFYTMTDHKW